MLFRFKLTYSGEDTTVIEPKGWNTFKSEIKRDFNSHGVIFKYTSGTLKLGFADGRGVLENAFQNDGYDAVVTLTVDQRASDLETWVNAFTGNAVMKNRDLNRDYFECDFETSTFQQKIINRLDIPVDIERTIDLDGNTLSRSVDKKSDSWPTIRLNRIYEAMTVSEESTFQTYYDGTHTTTEDSTTTKELKATFGFGVNKRKALDGFKLDKSEAKVTEGDYGSTTFDPPEPLWIAPTGGTTLFEGLLAYQLNAIITSDASATLNATYALKLVQYRNGSLQSSTTIKTETHIEVGVTSINHTFTGSLGNNIGYETFSETITHNAGDYFYLIFELDGTISTGSNSMAGTIFIYGNDYETEGIHDPDTQTFVRITHLPVSINNTVNHWRVHDVFDRLTLILSGEESSEISNHSLFYSSFFGLLNDDYVPDGCGGFNTITNGYQLRGIDRPLNISMREMLDWAQARYGVGWGFEKVLDGGYRIRVELIEFFYGNNEILDLGSPLDIKEGESYKEDSFPDLEINNVKIGYNEFFNQIGINGTIEDFLTQSTYSLPLSTIKGSYNKTNSLIASNDIIQATFDQRTLNTSWKYDENPFIVAVRRIGSNFIPENDENFESIGGLTDFETAYNVRHAPVYMFIEHALIINSALFGKGLSSEIQNTSVKINTSFNATFNQYEDCLLADSQRLQRSSTGNITIENNFEGLRLFKPVQHTFTVAMTATQLTTIITAMENDRGLAWEQARTPLGYLTYKDNSGTTQQGYPMTIIWNPNDEIAEVTTLEKADNYGL